MEAHEKYEKLYDLYAKENESFEDFVERYSAEQELKEAERGMEVYYEQ